MPVTISTPITRNGDSVPIIALRPDAEFYKGDIDGTQRYLNLSVQDGDGKVFAVVGDVPFYARLVSDDATGFSPSIAAGGDRVIPCLAGSILHIEVPGSNSITAATILEFVQWGSDSGKLMCIRV